MTLLESITGSLRRISFLFRKEVLAILKDPAIRVILIVPIVIQSLVFGYAATYDLNHVRYAVLNESRGAASTNLLARLEGSKVFVRAATLRNSSDIARAIDNGEALLVLHFAPDFDAKLASTGSAPVQLILDGRNSTTANMAAGHLSTLIGQFNASLPNAVRPPVNIEIRAWFNPNLESRWNIVPALIASLSMIQTLLLAALSVAREREQGTFDQLLVTPLRPMEILIGKASPAITIGLVQASLVFCVALFWFRIPFLGCALCGACRLYNGLRWYWSLHLGAVPEYAPGNGLRLRTHHAAHPVVRARHARWQHAYRTTDSDLRRPVAIRHRPGSPGLSGGCWLAGRRNGFCPDAGDSRDNASRCRMAFPKSADLRGMQ